MTEQRSAVNTLKDRLESSVREIQRRYQLFPPQNATVIVGVSGGADSVCLLHILCHLAPEWHLTLHVAHLDHALRPDSVADAEFVAQLARTYGLPLHQHRLEPGALAASPASVETAARHARQQFLAALAVQYTPAGQIPLVALAHHAEDQAETVLHHLVRGSGLQGLSGMRPVTAFAVAPNSSPTTDPFATEFPATTNCASSPIIDTITDNIHADIHLVRPLLYVRRATILQYLTAHNLTWREDSTNQEQQYTRNYIRHTVMPALAPINPAAVEALGRMATLALEEVTRLADYDREALARLRLSADQEEGERIVLDLDALRRLAGPTQRALLRMAIAHLAPIAVDLSLAHIDALVTALETAVSSGPHPLLADLMWSVAGATAMLPARLSLHRRETLPFLPDQLLLAGGQQIILPAVAMGETVCLEVATGRQLSITLLLREELPADWRTVDQPWRAFFDADCVGTPIITTAREGQQFAPLGMDGRQKALGDFFTDRKIPVTLRMRWPILIDVASDTVLWVCGLQMAHPARITEQTERVLRVSIE